MELRRVEALVEINGTDKVLVFITNNLDWAASSIGDLYKARWGIDVFFKQLKQTLQLAHFLGHSKSCRSLARSRTSILLVGPWKITCRVFRL